MLEMRDLAGLAEAERKAIARETGPLQALHEVISLYGGVLSVVVQDEFTHDVVVQRGSRFLAFGTT